MKLSHRIQMIEDLLKNETPPLCMVATKTDQGFEWNGIFYNDDDTLHEAMETICGRNSRKPLVIISLHRNREKDPQ